MKLQKPADTREVSESKIKYPLRNYTPEERLERASLRVALVIREMLEETGHSHSRLLEGPLLPDDLTEIGMSDSITEGGWREHVVPCRVVIYECHRRFASGESDADVAKYIRDHVKIVRISDAERRLLDGRESGLKQSMPGDWKYGDDIFRRLANVGVKWTKYTRC